jgi:putative membrane protein
MVRLTRPALAGLVLAATLAACSKSKDEVANGAVDTAKPADSAAMATVPDTTHGAATTTTSKWTSPSVVGFAETANSGEVTLGRLAQKKATNPAVKAFAREMVTDHSAMLADTKKLATKLKVTPDTASDDVRDLMNSGHDAVKELTDKKADADWDKNYMDKMVNDHQKVLDKLNDARKNTTDADVQAALDKSIAKVQDHLTKAQNTRSKLP